MSEAPIPIPLDQLHPNPDNPRLAPRLDVVDRLAAQIGEAGGFDPAHALIVRPHADGFQILSGHHRKLAAAKAGLAQVLCWVRSRTDQQARMDLVLHNTQGELNDIEEAVHCYEACTVGGMTQDDYRKETGWSQPRTSERYTTGKVCKNIAIAMYPKLVGKTRQITIIAAVRPWLWPALIARLVAEGWNVETTRANVGRFKDLPEAKTLPPWLDLDAVAEALVAGEMKVADVERMTKAAKEAALAIDRLGLDVEHYRQALDDRLAGIRPGSLSVVTEVCRAVLDAQTDAKRQRDQQEEATKLAALKAAERAARRAAMLRKAVTLRQWIDLDEATRQELLNLDPTTVPRRAFNEQKGMDIEWAMKSHNPLTGCRHDCIYCYARDIAENLVPTG